MIRSQWGKGKKEKKRKKNHTLATSKGAGLGQGKGKKRTLMVPRGAGHGNLKLVTSQESVTNATPGPIGDIDYFSCATVIYSTETSNIQNFIIRAPNKVYG